ncbi:MAG: tetraacyldisaccharide 4'-kinase [Pseudomonadota bacterium]
MFRAPQFWNKRQWICYVLIPFSWIWTLVSRWNEERVKPESVSVPVICVGNLVMGGAGKTPTVIALVNLLKSMGYVPHIISRGYGAHIRDTILVDPAKHNYLQVGDEPLLLAQAAPTWAGPNRVSSAKIAISRGASVLVMDDGLQNPSLHKDLSFIVIDSIQGIGNGLVFPAGPLREPIESGVDRAQAMIVIGQEKSKFEFISRQFLAKINCLKSELEHNKNKRVVAFAGIGYPDKFRNTLLEKKFEICQFIEFADHHPYTIHDMLKLVKLAEEYNATLLTTTKDWLRVPSHYRKRVESLPIELNFDEPEKIRSFIETVLGQERTQKTLSKIAPAL